MDLERLGLQKIDMTGDANYFFQAILHHLNGGNGTNHSDLISVAYNIDIMNYLLFCSEDQLAAHEGISGRSRLPLESSSSCSVQT